MDIDEAFKKYTKHKEIAGQHKISCVKGLWSVSGPTRASVDKEAKHYFWQYFEDGEYE